MDQQVLNAAVGPNATVDIENPRGDVSITAGDGSNVEVQAHAIAYASSDVEANKIFAAEAAHVTVSSNAVLVKSEGNNNGRINLTVTVPKSARVTMNAGRGDVAAAGLGGGLTVSAPHGDVHVSAIVGNVQVHLANDKHDFSAHQVDGDITVEGHCNDLTFSEVKGKIAVNGEIFGETHMENIAGPVHLHTSVTDLEVASLPGDLTLNPDDLRVTEAKGQVRVITHSKDVDLNQVYGESYVEDRDGRISVEPAGPFGVNAKNTKGDVEVTLPPNASATVSVRTRNGDIVSDFSMPSTEGENKSATFTIGSGGSQITLSAENGDVHIKKGSSVPPPPPSISAAPRPPVPPNAPHLKAPKQLPPPPVTQ
jgi:DUF4097 and DUF4098 domain-containing protein YvlB